MADNKTARKYDRKPHHHHQSISITINLITIIIRRHREDLDALMGGTLETLVMFEKDCMSEYTANVIIIPFIVIIAIVIKVFVMCERVHMQQMHDQ